MNEKTLKNIARILLGGNLIFAGISHLTFARKPFRAQVPDWVPLGTDVTVVCSGIAEIALGSTLVLTDKEHQGVVGKIAAAFSSLSSPATSRSMFTGGTRSDWTRTRRGLCGCFCSRFWSTGH